MSYSMCFLFLPFHLSFSLLITNVRGLYCVCTKQYFSIVMGGCAPGVWSAATKIDLMLCSIPQCTVHMMYGVALEPVVM